MNVTRNLGICRLYLAEKRFSKLHLDWGWQEMKLLLFILPARQESSGTSYT
jgi:hypothetical protein